MTLLFLIRHGMTDAVGSKLVGRAPGVPLNDVGRAQAEALSTRLASVEFGALSASPLERAMRTASAIASPRGLEINPSEALTDVDFGEWTGKTLMELRDLPEFRRFNTHRSTTRPPGGEHTLQVQERMVTHLAHLALKHPNQTVLVVSHADPIRAALAYFLGMPIDFMCRVEVDPGSISRLELSGSFARALSINEQYHLHHSRGE